MKLQEVSRRYEARPDFNAATPILAQTPAQIRALANYPYLLPVTVNPGKPYRKVWAWIFNDMSGAFNLDYDLVCSNHGEEVYREKLILASNAYATTANQWIAYITDSGTGTGMFCEGILTQIQAAKFIMIPRMINITCDTIYLQVNTITGSLLHNGNLLVRSETGI